MFLRRWATVSIRDRLIRSFMIVAMATTVMAALGLLAAAWLLIQAELFTQLVSEAARLALMVNRDAGGFVFDYRPGLVSTNFGAGSEAGYFQLWRPDGTVLAKSASLGSASLPPPPLADPKLVMNPPDGQELDLGDVMLPSGRMGQMSWIRWNPLRGVGPRVESMPDERLVVVVALDLQSYRARLLVVGVILAGAVAVVLVGLRWVCGVIVTRGLRSLVVLSGSVSRLDESRFAERFDDQSLPRETAPLARAINSLLGKAQSALNREKRFGSSAAHELRTPIAEIRAVAEVARRIGTVEAANTALAEITLTACQMDRVLGALLRLSKRRLEVEREALAAVRVGEVVAGALQRHRAGLERRGMKVSVEMEAPVVLWTEPAAFATIVNNLIDNAVEYTPDGGEIRVSADRDSRMRQCTLRVANAPVEMNEDEVSRVFEPFWRKDPTRGGGEHSGLGLALVQALCQSLDGDVMVAMDPPGWFSVVARVADAGPSGKAAAARSPEG